VSLATLDMVIIGVVLLSAGIGLLRGLVREVLSLVSWIGAFVLAIYFAPQLAAALPLAWGNTAVRVVMAFAGILIATLIAASLLQWLVSRLIASTGLTGTDRILGLLFGSVRGILICLVVLMGLREVAADRAWWQASILQVELLSFEDDMRKLLDQARDMIRDNEGFS